MGDSCVRRETDICQPGSALSNPKTSFALQKGHHTLKIQTQKRLGTRLYIVEMLQVCNDKAHIGAP